nr:TlpA disulfide reductase family protein [uncultured Maribacter sp.]
MGDKFPNIQLPLLSKDTVYIKDVLGEKLTIIDLWASWCAPCRLENRKVLVPLYNEYHDQGLQIVAYALESDEAAWKAAAARDGTDRWLQSSDLKGDDAPFLKKIRVRTIPANFILDSNEVVIAKNLHGQDLMDLVKGSF